APLVDEAIRSMVALNRVASEALRELPAGTVHACTDVTGFGLIGHACEMAAASGVTLEIDAPRVPVLGGGRGSARLNRSGGLSSNEAHFGGRTCVSRDVDPDSLTVFHDPQTSGGLLIAAAAEQSADVAGALAAAGVHSAGIGRVRPLSADIQVEI